MIYLVVTFSVAWILQIVASTVLRAFFQPMAILIMTVPALATVIVCKGLGTRKTGIGWHPRIRENWKSYLIVWFVPALLTAVGAVLYFVVFPARFDPDLGYMVKTMEHAGAHITDGTLKGMSMKTLLAVSAVQAVTMAPLLNGFIALGEEIGWRGFMTPVLQTLTGRRTGLIIAGVIWGLWHAPMIVLAGYEYGRGYFGAPVTGVLLFCVFTTAVGIMLSFLYEKTGSIWIPAIFHGAMNAAATIPVCFTAGTEPGMLAGPGPNGWLAGLPFFIIGVVLLFRKRKKRV